MRRLSSQASINWNSQQIIVRSANPEPERGENLPLGLGRGRHDLAAPVRETRPAVRPQPQHQLPYGVTAREPVLLRDAVAPCLGVLQRSPDMGRDDELQELHEHPLSRGFLAMGAQPLQAGLVLEIVEGLPGQRPLAVGLKGAGGVLLRHRQR